MLDWFVAIPLLAACWLLWDGLAGLGGWRGLRSTPLRPLHGLVLAALALVLFVLMAATTPVSTSAALLGVLLALALHLVLAMLLQRSFVPSPWVTVGEWERHRATAVEIPASTGSVPALVFEPRGTSVGSLLLVHGAGAHKTFYSWPVVDRLVEGGFTVCAIDLDGHGDNRRTLDFPAVLEDVEVAVAWLRQRSDWVGAVGVSLGGCITARAAAEGVQLDALAILEAPVDVEVTPRVIRHEYLTLLRAATWSLHRYAGTIPLIRAWPTEPARSRISTLELIRRLDLLGSLARVRCPLWLCYADNDYVVPLSQAHAAAAAAPPGTPLVIVRRATHLSLQLDRRALRPLQKWLKSCQQSAVSSHLLVERQLHSPADSPEVTAVGVQDSGQG